MVNYKISLEQLQAIFNYLGNQPFAQVEPLVNICRQVAQDSNKIVQEEPKE